MDPGHQLLPVGRATDCHNRFPDSGRRYARNLTFANGAPPGKSSGLDLPTRRPSRRFAVICCHARTAGFHHQQRLPDRARPRIFYQHMMEQNRPAANLPDPRSRLLGAYEGLRGYHIVPEGRGDTAPAGPGHSKAAGAHPCGGAIALPLLPEEWAAKAFVSRGRLARDLQQVDLRSDSCGLTPPRCLRELLEVHWSMPLRRSCSMPA